MFLNNYYEMLRLYSFGGTISFKNITGGSRTDVTNATYRQVYNSKLSPYDIMKNGMRTTDVGIVLGNGTAEVTKDDYKLSGTTFTTSNLSATTVVSVDTDSNGITTATAVMTITAVSDVTISEVGLVGYIYNGSTNGTYNYVLFDRTLLDSPVSLAAGEVGQVIYKVSYTPPA